MEAQLKELRQTVESQRRELLSTQQQMEKLRQQRDELDMAQATHKREQRENEDRIRKLIEEQAGLKGEINATKEGMTRVQAKADELASEKKELAEKVREFTVQLTVSELKMEKLKSDVALQEEKVKAQAKEISEKEQLLKSATADMLDMQKKLAVVDCEARDLSRQVTRNKVTYEEQERNLQRLMSERMELTLQLSVKDQTHQKLDESRMEEIRALQADKAGLNQKLSDATTTIQAQEASIAKWQADYTALQTQLQEAQAAVKTLSEAKVRADEALQASEAAREATDKELTGCKSQMDQLSSELEVMKVTYAKSIEELAACKAENEQLTASVKEFNRNLETAVQNSSALLTSRGELQTINEQLTNTRRELEGLQAEKASLLEKQNSLAAKVESLQQKLKEAVEAKSTAEGQVAALEASKSDLEQKVAQSQRLHEAYATLDAKYQQLKGHFQKAMQKIEDLRAQRDQKQDQLEALEHSASRMSAEFNSRMTRNIFESEEWRAVLQDIQERVVAHTPAPEQTTETTGGSLLNIFTRSSARRRTATANDTLSRSLSRISGSLYGSDMPPSDSQGSLAAMSHGPAELLEELAALKVRNKVLEDTLAKMQSVITSSAAGL